jgi:hypothetical protein
VGKNSFDLLASDAGEPFQKIRDRRPTLDILEKRSHRNSRSLEKPGSADLPRNSFDGGTLSPIQHDIILGRARMTYKSHVLRAWRFILVTASLREM